MMRKIKKIKSRSIWVGVLAVLAIFIIAGMSAFVVSEVGRSKDCVNTHISSGEKVRRCANGYVGLTLESADKKAMDNGLYPQHKTLGDNGDYDRLNFKGAAIMFDIKAGIVVNAHIDRSHLD